MAQCEGIVRRCESPLRVRYTGVDRLKFGRRCGCASVAASWLRVSASTGRALIEDLGSALDDAGLLEIE